MPKEYKEERRKPSNLNLCGLLLYVLPAPLFIKVFVSLVTLKILPLALSVGALFFFYSGAYMTRNTMARLAKNRLRPKPKEISDQRPAAMIYVGTGVLLVMFMIKFGINARTIGMPIFAMLGYYLVYGIRETVMESPIDFDAMPKATREAIEGAYKDLEEIEILATKLTRDNDKAIAKNTEHVITQSYKILGLLGRSPNDAGQARRFLNVYVHRIKEILAQYINLAHYEKADDYRERLVSVLEETYKAFDAQESKLLDGDQLKLDVQLEVLDEQIKHENK